MPLDRALSKLGLASRADARALVAAGRVRVNGRRAHDPARLVVPERIHVAVDDQPVEAAAKRLIAFHKPRGVVTSRRDPAGRRTVFDLLGPAGHGLHAVGRLDQASTGLLLFTNDTQLSAALTDPANRVVRRYVVTVRGRLTPETAARIARGIDVCVRDGATERLCPGDIVIRKASARETHLIVDLTEGKNRELRRLFDAVGHDVTRIHRVQFGRISLGTLQPGEWREEPLGDASYSSSRP